MNDINPLHEVGGPETAWTTVNTAENFPGVATPLGWTFWRDPLERGMKGAFCDLGVLPRAAVVVPDSVDDRFSAAVYGRFAANVDCLRQMADRLPGTSADALEEQLLGSVRPGVTSAPSRRRYPVVALKMPSAVLRLPRRLAGLRAETDTWWRSVTAPGGIESVDQARAVFVDAGHRFEAVMRPHSIVTLLGTGIFDQVKALAAARGRPGLETTLISGYGGIEEATSAAELWQVSRGERSLDAFLAGHGYHAPVEAEIASRAWREDPAPLERLLARYAELSDETAPAERLRRQQVERERAEADLQAGCGRAERARARFLLGAARRYVPLREVGKAAFLQTIDGARAAARFLGAHLARTGALSAADDVYFLTADELLGRAGLPVVRDRRATFEEYRALELPDTWVGVPQPLRTPEPGAGATRVQGMPVSPGVVNGVARVVTDAAVDDIEPGEILVCRTTDPSWASFFLVAAAVVIDIGGPLSHGAIVAREMGIPCVINTGNGTRLIRSGDRVQVDGSTGLVEIMGAGTVGAGTVGAGTVGAQTVGAEIIEVDMVEFDLLQTVRFKGRPLRDDLAADPQPLMAQGLLREAGARIALTGAGRERLAALAAVERATVDQAAFAAAYEEFDPVNTAFKQLITDWQLIDGAQPNDHSDPAYDQAIVDRLGVLDATFAPLLDRFVTLAPRLAGYRGRFATALAAVRAGDHGWIARPLVDSYHTVWFELHEELIGLAGLSRAEEAAAGRAS